MKNTIQRVLPTLIRRRRRRISVGPGRPGMRIRILMEGSGSGWIFQNRINILIRCKEGTDIIYEPNLCFRYNNRRERMSLALTLEFSGGAELLVGNVKRHDVTIQGYIYSNQTFFISFLNTGIFLLLLSNFYLSNFLSAFYWVVISWRKFLTIYS